MVVDLEVVTIVSLVAPPLIALVEGITIIMVGIVEVEVAAMTGGTK